MDKYVQKTLINCLIHQGTSPSIETGNYTDTKYKIMNPVYACLIYMARDHQGQQPEAIKDSRHCPCG
jgi:hypothetical protein